MAAPLIGFIVKNSQGKFVAVVGTLAATSEGADKEIKIVGAQPPADTLEEAQAAIKDEDTLEAWYLDAVGPQPNNHFTLSMLGLNHKDIV
jgi:hypothetical protein